MTDRPEPVRTCVGCRAKDRKGALLRVVRAGEGMVRVDPIGSAVGRGAHVHRNLACIDAAFRRGGLARALRTGLGPVEAARLRADIEREAGRS